MKSISKKAKKEIIVTGIAVVCVGIVSAVILNTNSKVKANSNKAVKNSSAAIVLSSDISPDSINEKSGVVSNSGEKAFDPSKESSRSEPLTTLSKPSSKPPKPTIEGSGKNGSQPTNSALTNKSKKPAYKTTPKAPTKKSSVKSNTSTKKSTSGSTTGGFNPNKAWGTGGQETTVDGNWGAGSQVGIMD